MRTRSQVPAVEITTEMTTGKVKTIARSSSCNKKTRLPQRDNLCKLLKTHQSINSFVRARPEPASLVAIARSRPSMSRLGPLECTTTTRRSATAAPTCSSSSRATWPPSSARARAPLGSKRDLPSALPCPRFQTSTSSSFSSHS